MILPFTRLLSLFLLSLFILAFNYMYLFSVSSWLFPVSSAISFATTIKKSVHKKPSGESNKSYYQVSHLTISLWHYFEYHGYCQGSLPKQEKFPQGPYSL